MPLRGLVSETAAGLHAALFDTRVAFEVLLAEGRFGARDVAVDGVVRSALAGLDAVLDATRLLAGSLSGGGL